MGHSKLPIITDNGAPIPLTPIPGSDSPPLDFDHIPRYGLWNYETWKGCYQCTDTSDDLPALQAKYNVTDDRIVKTNVAAKMGIPVVD